jgi:hypothetical protein
VLQLIVLVVVVCALGVAYVRLQRPEVRSATGFRGKLRDLFDADALDHDPLGEPRRDRLSMSMFHSIANGRRRRASDGAIFVDSGGHVAVASARDAAVIHASPAFFDQDINKLIDLNRSQMNLKAAAPIVIETVIEDSSVPDGAPYLLTVAEARRRARTEQQGADQEPTPQVVDRDAADDPAGHRGHAIAGTLVPRRDGLRPITVTAPGQTLGRNPRHGPGAIAVTTVSWEHARISLSGSQRQWEITDSGSRHGTYLNGKDLRAEPGSQVLADGDFVGFGPDAEYQWNAYTSGYTPTA